MDTNWILITGFGLVAFLLYFVIQAIVGIQLEISDLTTKLGELKDALERWKG
jgi:hypothetical protein